VKRMYKKEGWFSEGSVLEVYVEQWVTSSVSPDGSNGEGCW
jgi:hypothetical protein